MPRRKIEKDNEMVATIKKIKRINHVAELCKKKGWGKQQFIREAMYHTFISDRTLEKIFDGATTMDVDTLELLAMLFNVTKEDILESVW
jgi:hypothetical protein